MFLDLIQKRCSTRIYDNRPVEEELLQKILEAGRIAPSAKNEQNFKILVAKGEQTREIMESCGMQSFVGDADVFLAVAAVEHREMRCREEGAKVDASICLTYMMLEATELGLGTCWLGNFDDVVLGDYFGLRPSDKVVCAMSVGYSAQGCSKRPKKALEELVIRKE